MVLVKKKKERNQVVLRLAQYSNAFPGWFMLVNQKSHSVIQLNVQKYTDCPIFHTSALLYTLHQVVHTKGKQDNVP